MGDMVVVAVVDTREDVVKKDQLMGEMVVVDVVDAREDVVEKDQLMGDMVVVDVVNVRVEVVEKFSRWIIMYASICTINQTLIVDFEGQYLELLDYAVQE